MTLGSAINLTSGEPLTYRSWPWDNGKYDAARNQLPLLYNAGSVHDETAGGNLLANYDRIARCIIKPSPSTEDMGSPANTFGSPVTVYSESGTCCFVHGMVILANGDYLAIISRHDHPLTATTNQNGRICKSTDGGATWTNADIGIAAGWFGGLHVCPSGRIISYAYQSLTLWTAGVRRIIYSDDNGATWTAGEEVNISLAPVSGGYYAWETTFMNLADGRIVSLSRSTTGGTNRRQLLWSISSDGITWAPYKPTSLWSQEGTPHMLRLDGKIYTAFSDRGTSTSGIYLAESTDERLAGGDFGIPRFLFGGTSDINFGYPNLSGVGSRIWLHYYSGPSQSSANVFERRITI